MSLGLLLFVLTVVLGLSAFFSGSEVALFSIPRARVEVLAKSGDRRAKRLHAMIQRPKILLATLLLGNTLTHMAMGTLVLVVGEDWVHRMGIQKDLLPWIVLGMDLGATVLILLFGEITPKLFASRYQEALAPLLAGPLQFFVWLLNPFVGVALSISEGLLKRLGVSLHGSPTITKEEIQTLVSVGENTGVLEPEEADMVEGFFGFRERVVSEIMIPRVRMVSMHQDTTVEGALEKVREHGFSRFPVYADTIDHITGVLLVKDLLGYLDQPSRTIAALVKPVSFVPETKPLADLLRELQSSNVHFAVVLDEYGGTHGMVTIEDLLEEIFGEIKDEYDEDEMTPWQKTLDGALVADAALPLHEVAEILETEMPEEEVDTLGGLLVTRLGRVPKVGESVEAHGFRIQALEVKGTRVQRVQVTPAEEIGKDNGHGN